MNKCTNCSAGIKWHEGATITDDGYRCLSCTVMDLSSQNKRYLMAFESIDKLFNRDDLSNEMFICEIEDVLTSLKKGDPK